MTGRRITSADVARRAGVSRATVSYVLNAVPGQKIPDHTRDRVLAAVADLGYAPSAAARTLRAGRSDVVLCLLPDWPIGAAVGTFLDLLSTALAGHGLTFVMHPRARADRPVTDVWKAITPCAVVLFEDLAEPELAAMRAAGVRLACVVPGSTGTDPDHRVGRLQAEHLAGAGHVRLGYARPDDDRVLAFVTPRLTGVRAVCAERGLPAPDVRTVPLAADGAAEAVTAWLRNSVTAICAYNDEVAIAVLAGLRHLGRRAPADLAVIGVDDIPTAALSVPPLTTIVVEAREHADHVVRTIVTALSDQPTPPQAETTPVRLIPRESA